MYKPDEAHKLLGVLTDPAGTTKEQVAYMVTQAKDWNERLLNTPISSALKRIAYSTELLPRLVYPLSAVSLTQQECWEIMNYAMPTIKHGLGLSRKTVTEVLYFPYAFGGYGVLDLHLAQVTEQSRFMIQHLRNKDSVEKRIRISIEVSQLESGMNEKITRNGETKNLRYITPTIITSLMEDLWDLRAELWLNHWTPKHGRSIMEEMKPRVRDLGQLVEINTCRTWLRVHHLSDLATMDGHMIHPAYAQGKRVHESEWSWPRWVPPKLAWNTWRSALQSYIEQLFPLKSRPMGHQKISSWVNNDHTSVEIKGETYGIKKAQRNRSSLIPKPNEQIRMNPCDVYSDEGEIFLLPGKRLEAINEQAEPSRDTFIKSLIALEPSFEYIFREMPHSEEDHSNIADLMIRKSLVVGSDGRDDQNGRIVCAIILASEDLLD